jgi:hypothetical protein
MMTELSDVKEFVKASFGSSTPDVVVHVNCHGNLVLNKKMQKSSNRVDSYDLFILPDNFVDHILIFVLSGLSNSASTEDPMNTDVFPTIRPNKEFADIFNDLDNIFKETNPERIQQYIKLRAPLGSYSVMPLIEDQKFTNAFINKYVYIGGGDDEDDVNDEDDEDIYIIDNEGNEIRISDLASVAKLLAKKRKITYYAAIDLVENAVTVDTGLVSKGFSAGHDVILPGNFNDKRRLRNDRIQRITLKEVLFLLYLLGYRNPLILDSSCSGNYSSKGPYAERASGRAAAKNQIPLIAVSSLLRIDNKKNTNLTYYDTDNFDKVSNRIIENSLENLEIIMESAPGCSENLALIAANENNGSFLGGIEFAKEVLIVISSLGCTEKQAIEGIMETKNQHGLPNAVAAIQYLNATKKSENRIKKTMRRKKHGKTVGRKRIKKSIKLPITSSNS